MEHEEVIKYVIEIKDGDTTLFPDLMKKCGFTYGSMLKKYKGLLLKYNIEFDDFKQELILAFMQGTYEYPIEHGNFIAYMFSYLKYYIYNFLRENTNRVSQCDRT